MTWKSILDDNLCVKPEPALERRSANGDRRSCTRRLTKSHDRSVQECLERYAIPPVVDTSLFEQKIHDIVVRVGGDRHLLRDNPTLDQLEMDIQERQEITFRIEDMFGISFTRKEQQQIENTAMTLKAIANRVIQKTLDT